MIIIELALHGIAKMPLHLSASNCC